MANGKDLSGDLARCARIFGGGKLLAAPWPNSALRVFVQVC